MNESSDSGRSIDTAVFDRLADEHPVIVELASRSRLGPELGVVARALARRVAGLVDSHPPALASLLLNLGRREFELLELLCRGQPHRAIAATVAVLRRLVGKFELPEVDGEHEEDEDERQQLEQIELREQLSQLAGRRLPDELYVPDLHGERDVVAVAASYAAHLELGVASGAAVQAVVAASETFDALAQLVPGLGWDFSVGHLQRAILADLTRLQRLADGSQALRKIVDELGRQEASEHKRRAPAQGGREDVVGVTIGGELSDVLTCELALLGTAETEDLFYQRFIEHRLVCLQLHGSMRTVAEDGDQRGPIVACIDTSGSMSGAPEIMAKALVLSILQRALKQGRRVHLMMFGGPGEFTDLEIYRGSRVLHAVLDFLSMSFHAGTDFDGPLLRALQLIRSPEYRRADVLVVTDGLCRASRGVCREVEAARVTQEFRIVSVVFGGDVSGVKAFSDKLWRADPDSDTPLSRELW